MRQPASRVSDMPALPQGIVGKSALVVSSFDMRLTGFLLFVWVLLLPQFGNASNLVSPISIGIFYGRRLSACTVSGTASLELQDESGSQVAQFPASSIITVTAKGDQVQVSCASPEGRGESKYYIISSSEFLEIGYHGGKIRRYRGRLLVSSISGNLILVNEIGLEDYLRGVLPGEIPPGFAPEALRAQAIAARTYTIASGRKHLSDSFQICDSTHCQVYLGASGEDTRTDAAVKDTAGLIITYQGKPIHAVYHDTCGGRTAANEDVWPGRGPFPYLRSVSDYASETAFCGASPRSAWTRELTQAQLTAALKKFGVTAPIFAFEPGERLENGRPKTYHIRGSQGEWTIPAGPLRDAVNRALGPATLPSGDFTTMVNGDVIAFTGRGSGHGVGLCQWGANGLAKSGKTAQEILVHYYPGTVVEANNSSLNQQMLPYPQSPHPPA